MTSLANSIGSVSEGVVVGPQKPAQSDCELRNREHFYRELLEALPTAIYTTDTAGRVTFYNQAAVALAGRSPELGSDRWCVSWRLLRPDGTPMAHNECPMAIALREDRAIRGTELIAERPDGVRIPILPCPTPLHDESGKLVGAVNMLVDISDRKNAERALRRLNATLQQNVEERSQELEEASAKLHESERDFRMLVQSVTDYAIFMLDQDGFIINWNVGAERIKGYKADEIVGQHFSRFYTEQDRAAGIPQRALAIAAREGKYEAEGWRVHKDGRLFWASVIIDPIRDDAGRLVDLLRLRATSPSAERRRKALPKARNWLAASSTAPSTRSYRSTTPEPCWNGTPKRRRSSGGPDMTRLVGV